MDEPGAMGRSYGAKTTPHMYIIDPTGKVVYNGAIDDKRSTNPEDVKTAKNGHIHMAAADQPERHRAVEGACTGQCADRPAAGVREQWMGHALLGNWSRADQSILRLEEYFEARWNVVGNQGRNANAEVDQVT